MNERGQKRFLAIADGVHESKRSWREVLIGLKHRGLVAPSLAVGDGALGFWAALKEVFPVTRTQRCRGHYADLRIMPTGARGALSEAANALARSA